MPDDVKARIDTPQNFVANAGMSRQAAFVASGLNINALRTNDLLRKDEWLLLDTRVVRVARSRLIGIADLQAAGLTLDLGGLGTLLSEYEKQSEMTDANIDMSGVAPGQEDSVGYTLVSIPIPITHKDFRINIRRLEASRKLGQTIDTVQAEAAARKVRDGLESTLFNGASGIVVNANPLYGYTNFPDRNTYSGSDWGTIGNIYTDFLGMISAAEADNFFGPYDCYVAKTQFGQMRAVHTDGTADSAIDRVLAKLPQINSVKVSDVLADGSALLIQMERDVVDLAVGQDISTVEWGGDGGFTSHFKVMACMAQRIKSDDESQCGIVHATGI